MEAFAFNLVMGVLEDYDSPEENVRSCFEFIRKSLVRTDAEGTSEEKEAVKAASEAFEYWAAVREKAARATTRQEIKDLAREFICSTHKHSASPYNIAQGAMKATIHYLWKKLYLMTAARGHSDPAEAARDALMPPQARAIEYFKQLCTEIAAENGETTEAMMDRVCGDDAEQ